MGLKWIGGLLALVLAGLLAACSTFGYSTTTPNPDEATLPINTLLAELRGMQSCRLNRRIELLHQMASHGEVSVPYLFDALSLRDGCPDEYLFELEDILADMCSRYPGLFTTIALDNTEAEENRWQALFAIRKSRQVAGYEAVVGILTEEDSIQLRIQAVWALDAIAGALSHEEILRSEDGLINLLRSQEVRRSDKENIIALLASMKSTKAVPHLIELLNDTHVYSSSLIGDECVPNTMSKYAY
ncbi:MAG: HEAT repeat domain-containing protein, partial [Chloroflexi bacterium]|nr:HEAT repeat domain-containing protein [Chloroflexota bacterium]